MSIPERTKLSEELEVGDHIRIGGWTARIMSITTPRQQFRFRYSVKIDERPLLYGSVVFPRGISIEVLP